LTFYELFSPERVGLDVGVSVFATAALPRWPAYAVAGMTRSVGTNEADLALVQAVLRGEAKAQRELLIRLLPHLRAVSRAMMGAGADAEDAVQNAALKVLEKAKSYRGEAKLERWARTVTTRTCIDQMRRRRRLREVGDDQVDVSSRSHEPAWESLPRPMRAYLDELPVAQRQAVVMRHVLEYSVAEIAELLDLPLDTAKSRLLYGRRALRKLIRRDLAAGEVRVQAKGGAR